MNLVSELDLPAFDYTTPDFSADRYHQQFAETRQRGWLARSPLAYIVLDKLPIIWSGTSRMSPNHGLAPDVS